MKDKLPPTNALPYRRKTLAALISSSVFALQTAHAAPVLEEVIVTSTKEMQNLQDVPQAITAFTTADIEKQGFVGIDEYAKKIPALSFSRREPGGTSVVFRGVATSPISFGTNSSSSVYLDEQPITSDGANANPRMIDIERLEALSGPQGTLFGDSSQSGALRIITNKADPSGFSAWIEGELGHVEHGSDEGGISAMVNIPINDNMAIRLVGFSFEEAGYIDNVLQSSPGGLYSPGGTFDNRDNLEKNINSGTESGARAALHWDINDDWLMDAMVVYQKTELDGFGDTNLDVGELEHVRYNDEYSEDEWYQIGLTLEGDLGFAELVVSAAYFERDSFYQADSTDYFADFQSISDRDQVNYNTSNPPAYYDVDFMFYDFGNINNYSPTDFSGDPRGKATEDSEEDRFSLEARLKFEGDDGEWNAIAGIFYNKTTSRTVFRSGVNEGFEDTKAFYYLNNLACAEFERDSNGDRIGANYDATPNAHPAYYACEQHSLNGKDYGSWSNTNNWFFGVYDSEIEDMAIFGEANIDLTEDFTVTVGGRWYENKRDRKLFQGGLAPDDRDPIFSEDLVNNVGDDKVSEDGFVGKLGVKYYIDYDKMVFATYSEGFRSGGGNSVKQRSVIPDSYDSDFLINHEVGFKTSWMDNRLRVNMTYYQMTWEDIQLQVDDPQEDVFSTGVINFAEAEIEGLETEIIFAITEGLEASLTHSYLDAALSKDDTVISQIDGAPVVVAQVEDGTRLPISPDQKGSLGLEYNFQNQWFGMDPYVKFDYSYYGDSVNSIEGLGATAIKGSVVKQESYETMDFAIGMSNEEWSGSLKLENITDERAQQFFNQRWGTTQRVSINKPRNLTLTVRRSF
ncbi:TonB-dependent receptor [Dasania sp. GY-MA-18]|uniref:TonB-dependent receptor n=1 Tax=Dasania phycosphaerae TaxID=2950436 RepID=A0A9J6RNK6_9GAMM|nr:MULTISPECIES: TonB-dependent receptor [Dasania]MCR8923157.1 TonB-dependent receptor [Dasania sp. GY-MA-18]MCZ0865589.1 TonB-dependent receptor [Dasania phycosphaerae]MCZ0869314.1 TonB-dependent receptor [Dasania phycosphaerae]